MQYSVRVDELVCVVVVLSTYDLVSLKHEHRKKTWNERSSDKIQQNTGLSVAGSENRPFGGGNNNTRSRLRPSCSVENKNKKKRANETTIRYADGADVWRGDVKLFFLPTYKQHRAKLL